MANPLVEFKNIKKRFAHLVVLDGVSVAVERGESITITRHGVPVAVLSPTPEAKQKDGAKKIAEWRGYMTDQRQIELRRLRFNRVQGNFS